MESVRLVIWDLDETFWKGTLSEGGVEPIRRNQDIVIELARRGIISSICSKNDLKAARTALKAHDMWRYFVFPSVDWTAKGQRVAQIVESAQLRAETILFIDDNDLNLREAEHYCAGIQTASIDLLDTILDDPRFRGKDDSGLTRLNQYKQLEARHMAKPTEGNNRDFLYESEIVVQFEFDIESHIDRAIELINRTNQLNFTKKRLPEDPEEARAALRKLLSHYANQAALIHVSDKFGDHGFVGFYMVNRSPSGNFLEHFCFSCRILNMGVETWVYQMLESPTIHIVQPVQAKIIRQPMVDWIATERLDVGDVDDPDAAHFEFYARGGCDLMAVTHYAHLIADKVVGEFNIIRDAVPMRVDHSAILRLAADGISEAQMEALRPLGYAPDDFRTDMFDYQSDNPVILFSFWTDAIYGLYRHKRFGFEVPISLPFNAVWNPSFDVANHVDVLQFGPAYAKFTARLLGQLRDEYEFTGLIRETAFKNHLNRFLDLVPPNGKIFCLCGPETVFLPEENRSFRDEHMVRLNGWIRDVLRERRRGYALEILDFVESEQEITEPRHYDRIVYFRIFDHIRKVVESELTQSLAAE